MSTQHKFMIIKDRVEIYRDFTINLVNYIIDYYLDKETLGNDEDIKNHYNWCYNKVCEEFEKEGLAFRHNEQLRQYFYEFFYYQFYKKETQDLTLQYYEKFWQNIFDINKQKNKNVTNTMVELYNIFDTSVNKEKNILEIA